MRQTKFTCFLASLLAIGAAVVSGGCRIKSCAERYDCSPGQTCATNAGGSFSCVRSGGTRTGESCDAALGAPVTCGEGLGCLTFGHTSNGKCVAWCGSTVPCPAGTTCQTVATTKGDRMKVCL